MRHREVRCRMCVLALTILVLAIPRAAFAQDSDLYLPVVQQNSASVVVSQLAVGAASADKDEGDGGTTEFAFTVTRTGDTSKTASVSYAVSGTGATPADRSDFDGGEFPTGAVSFAAGDTAKTIQVYVRGDTELEPDETFRVTLLNPSASARIVTAVARGTIRNDDVLPVAELSISAASADKNEGDTDGTDFTFLVSRSGDSGGVTSVDYAVSGPGSSAANGFDFEGEVFPTGTITFASGETSKIVNIKVQGDEIVEPDEWFMNTLSNPTANTSIIAADAMGTIRNDDEEVDDTDPIAEAGRLSSEDDPEMDGPDPEGEQTDLPPEIHDAGSLVSIRCSTEDWTATDVRGLQDTINLNPNVGVIYPGALIQGKDLEDGMFTPITIPRAGGTIYMTNLKLEPDAEYYRDLPEMGAAAVKQAAEDILNTDIVLGTAANFSYEVEESSSYEHLLYEIGADARYDSAAISASLKGSFSSSTEKSRSFVFLKFVQVFYHIVFEDPELATSVFRDGAAFTDPEDQIGPGNPPLYVQSVSYGRMVFFVMESEHSAEDVKAAMEAAFKGFGADVEVRAGLTNQQVLEKTKISYHVVGGDAGLALAPIAAADPSEMFDKVKEFLADPEAAVFSGSNPGAPVAYTLRYLHDRTVARMSYSVNYDKRDCVSLLANENNGSTVRAGMAGGPGGSEFDDGEPLSGGPYNKVTQVRVWEAASIGSVQIVFDNADPDPEDPVAVPPMCCPIRGGENPTDRERVIFLENDQYVKSIAGTIGPALGVDTVVRSLAVVVSDGVNDREYGPYGHADTTQNFPFHFEAPPGNEIVGFYGRAGQPDGLVDAIGVVVRHRYVPEYTDYKVYRLGPAGIPRGGTVIEDWPAHPTSIVDVRQVHMGTELNSAPTTVQLELADGRLKCHGLYCTDPLPITCPVAEDDHIVAVTGRYGNVAHIEQINIVTAEGGECAGPNSAFEHNNYRFEAPPGYQIVGFYSKDYASEADSRAIDTLGVYVARTEE